MLNLDSLAQLNALKSQIKVEKNVQKGVVRGTASRFGFVDTDAGESFFITPDEMKRVLPGDVIEFTVNEVDGKSQAELDSLVETSLKNFVGKVIRKGPNTLVNTDHPGMNRWVNLTNSSSKGLSDDTWVSCRLTRHPFEDGKALAKVESTLALPDAAFIEHTVGKARFNVKSEFTPAVEDAVAAIDFNGLMAAQSDYEDATTLPFVTIDAASTQDMDDALCIDDLGTHWRLHVAIADPSLFVEQKSLLDLVAAQRNSSSYLPGETLHMLPKTLSVEWCSLQPNVKRPALLFSVDVQKETGEAGEPSIRFGFMQSQAKLSYAQVSAFIDGDASQIEGEHLGQQIQHLNALTTDLQAYRQANCLVMEDRPDYRFDLNEQGHIAEVREEFRLRAHQVVEECMLLTNRLTAQYLLARNAGLFLCHEGFRDDQHDTIKALLQQVLAVTPTDLNDFAEMLPILQQAQRHTDLPLAKMLAKSYQRTELLPTARPHWGLGFACYTTITSPIRKYLDLVLHRQLKAIWRGQPVPTLSEAEIASLQEGQGTGRALSNFVEQWLKAIYMKGHESQRFTGEIQHVMPSGFSVQLDGLGISGFINVKGWRDKDATYDEVLQTHHTKRGEFRLGQKVTIEVQTVDLERRNVQFNLVTQ
ncbi:VacB/RNase II family 3'-5' exoribonuclease [Salinispirillum sp. LH 10-3-1]|uniref:exoribonuclease II n=1 Tax=Salinispirillum sp. LH 10-3-1 TaxID=2952525 RepID=A0AB38YCN8_9GAMM